MDKIRRIIKVLRLQEYREFLNSKKLNIPFLDVETRWSSTYNMVRSLYSILGVVKEQMNIDKRLTISEIDETGIELFLEVYALAAKFTGAMQKADVLCSHFFTEWALLRAAVLKQK